MSVSDAAIASCLIIALKGLLDYIYEYKLFHTKNISNNELGSNLAMCGETPPPPGTLTSRLARLSVQGYLFKVIFTLLLASGT